MSHYNRWYHAIILAALIINLCLNTRFFFNFGFAVTHPSLSYSQKMHIRWGEFYDFMEFVRATTPEDAVIGVPSADVSWFEKGMTGSAAIIYYFLYPRKLHFAEFLEDCGDVTHAIVAGNWCKPGSTTPKGRFHPMPRVFKVYLDGLSITDTQGHVVFEQNLEDSETPWLQPTVPSSGVHGHQIVHDPFMYKPCRRVLERLNIQLSEDTYYPDFIKGLCRSGNRSEGIKVAYTQGEEDFWIGKVDLDLDVEVKAQVVVRCSRRNAVRLFLEVAYAGEGTTKVFSPWNQQNDHWEVLAVEDVLARAHDYGRRKGWDTTALRITGVGLHTAFPYKYNIGLLEF